MMRAWSPTGAGTNVTDALRCPSDEDRTIITVDMSRMNRIRWVDPVNRMACIEAGAIGRHIQTRLAGMGFTLGHEPDSVEFSTLGGWIATYASGMKKNRYGNIEDLVLDVEVVTPLGELRQRRRSRANRPASIPGAGCSARRASLGIVTSAVVKIFPLPEVQRYDALLFPISRLESVSSTT